MTERRGRLALALCLVLGIGVPAASGSVAQADPPERDAGAVEERDGRLVPRSLRDPLAIETEERSAFAPLAACPVIALANDGATSGNGRAPIARFRGVRAVYLITAAELAAGGLASGSSPTGIGWRYATAPGLVASGTLSVYLQNTADTTNLKSTSFATAIGGMTLVHSAATTLPNTTAPFDVPFAGGSPFTYTGGGLYVAFDWRYPVGTLSTTVVIACNTSLTNGLEFSQTTAAPPASDTLAASSFRPETRLTVNIANDVSVDAVMTMGQLPNGLSGPETVRAVVTNKGNAQSNVPVTLNVTGANSFTDTQTITALGSCGGQTTVSFAPFTPSLLGSNTVTVSVPADDVAGNNSKSKPLDNTVNRSSYKYPGSTATGGVGYNANTAEFLAKFNATSATQVDAVTVEFPSTIPAATYRVSIRADDAGTPGTPGVPLYLDSANRTVAAGSHILRLPAPVAVGPGPFYVGLAQTSTTNIGLSYDAEVPIRSGAFYLAVAGGAFSDFSPGNNFKLNLGVIVGACLVPLTSSVTPDAASICAGNPITFTGTATGGTGTLTRQWTENGVDLAGQTGTTVVVTHAIAGSFAYNAKVTDDGGCIDVVDAAASSGTWLASGSGCDDGNPCTGPDVCSGSVCSGPNPCDDGNACTEDLCGAGCSYLPVICDDDNVCTDDSCDTVAGCIHANNAALCSDGDPCSLGDACIGGTCVPGTASLPAPVQVCNPAAISIPISGAAAPYPSVITVSGQRSYLCEVTVGLNGITHAFPDDIDVLLARAAGANAIVMSDVGGSHAVSDLNLTLSDTAAASLPDVGPLVGGTYKPTNLGTGDVFPAPAPAATGGSALAAFAGTDPNGPWNLWVVDQLSPDGGSIASGWCVNVVSICTGNAECDDGNACTVGDACVVGVCQPGPATVCDDANVCTTDSCNPATGGCVFTNNATSCDDGNACTAGDTCGGGACQPGAPVACNDGNVCTDDSCDAQTGCVFTNNTAVCEDGNACTVGDVCGGGACLPGAPTICDDGNGCTADSCDTLTGACVFTNTTAACDDGNACTVGDVCGGGACQPGAPTNCDDGNVCTDDACNTSTGACEVTNNAAACDDGNACTTGDTCSGGACQSGPPTVCDDANLCTADSCDPQSGCAHAPLVCDDGNICTTDGCDPQTGTCAFTNNTAACSDGNLCTVLDTCADGSCQPGSPMDCNDDNVCTDDVCDIQAGGCVFTPNTASCEDGNACTSGDVCADFMCQPGSATVCADADLCTTDTCDPQAGCVFTPAVCNDANVCTDDACNPATGACAFTNNAAACDDGNACTSGDVCGDGACQPGAPTVCDDENLCTNDTCAPSTGCAFTPVVCDDSNACTDDSCDPPTGACAFTNNTAACSDGNACTSGDACQDGACQPTGPTVCDDANTCTDDSCDPQTGCVFAPNTVPCDDGSACTSGDVCGGGSCQPGAPTVCVDGNVCTTDGCDPQTGGCVFTNNSVGCEDGDPCTGGDTCNGGSCQPGGPAVPPETAGLVASTKTTFSWPATLFATQYDGVRGAIGALPVGPGDGDEVCFGDLGVSSLVDGTMPAVGEAFWYLVRGENGCFVGTYGTQSNGTPRVTTTCP